LGKFFEEIKKRKLRKWLAIYLSTSVTVIGVVHLLSIRYSLPSILFDILLVIILFGLLSVLIISWYHGEPGKQKVNLNEMGFHSLIILFATLTLYFVISSKSLRILPRNAKIVAVLPFTNMNSSEDDFFSDGITEDILTQLSKISDLKVISRTSVMKFKNTKIKIGDIAKDLGAGSILEGSVRRINNKVRIVAQLINANSDEHIWANTYDRNIKDIFSIQSEIAQKIARELKAKLLPKEKRIIDLKPTENMEAYALYLKGRHFYYNYNKNDNEKAITLFKKALLIDSIYALALAGLADAYSQRVTKYWRSNEWFDSSLVLGKKAVDLNPYLPEAYKALGSAYDGLGKKDLASINYKEAISLNPNYWSAILNYGQIKMFSGHYDEALYWIRKANQLAPDDIMGNISVGMVYKAINCNNTAISWVKRALLLDPENIYATFYLGDLYLNSGDFDNAHKYFLQSVKLDSNFVFSWFLGARLESILNNYEKAKEYYDNYMKITNSEPEYFYAHTLLKLNKTDSAMIILNKELKDYKEYLADKPEHDTFSYMAFAEIYGILNNKDKAFYWWQEAIYQGYTDIERIKLYPYFNDLRNEPKYKQLLNKMQTKVDSFKTEINHNYPEYAECN